MTGGLIADLGRADAYPPPAPPTVELRTTHASWVFLTTTEAWKIKRPVDLGFLDFTTIEKRRTFCEEEVRLNVRLAAEVYRGVVPVYLGWTGHSFVGPGAVVDWAVRMRRLPDQDSALSLLAAGHLGYQHLERLAQHLASFYRTAQPTPDFGSAAVWAANVRENFAQVRPHIGRYVDAATFAEVEAWHDEMLRRHAGHLEERMMAGRIREGHGDLRLEHVYFSPAVAGDTPLVIDAIEFNRRFRCLDAALDVAFFAMELEAAERPDLSAWLLSVLARETNDYGMYPLLDFYLSYRAWVRAKVACFVASDRGTPGPKAELKTKEATRLFALARSFRNRPAPTPWLIAMGGLPGSGKTSTAERLGRRLGIPVVSSDRTRKCLAGLNAEEPGSEALYTEEMNRRTYAEMYRRAQQVLDSGRGVILDATFASAARRNEARALARRNRRCFLFVETTCADPVIRQRLRGRVDGHSVSDAREGLLAPMRVSFGPPAELSLAERAVVDTAADVDAQLQILVERLTRGAGER